MGKFTTPTYWQQSTPPQTGDMNNERYLNAKATLEMPGAQAPQSVTITDGSISPTCASLIVDTEGSAAADDLTVINTVISATENLHDGMILSLRAADASRTVTVVNSTAANGISTLSGSNVPLDTKTEMLLRLVSGKWYEVSQGGLASSSNFGLCKPDGSTLTASSGVLSVAKSPILTTARNIFGLNFNGSANISNFGTCSTAAATAAKTVSITNFSLGTGAVVNVKFTNVNTAESPTLNVTSTGAKSIRYCGVSPEVGQLAAGQTYTMLYDGSYWQILAGMAPWFVGQYQWFQDELSRPGWVPCNGNIVASFSSSTWPQMAAYLSTTHGQARRFSSLADYESAHDAVWATLADGTEISWDNIGGVAKFYWDTSANKLYMPDLTGMFQCMAGFDSLGVGDVQGDTGRKITGRIGDEREVTAYLHSFGKVTTPAVDGVYSYTHVSNADVDGGNDRGVNATIAVTFDSGRVVPVGPANAPRRWGALVCCYLGTPAS